MLEVVSQGEEVLGKGLSLLSREDPRGMAPERRTVMSPKERRANPRALAKYSSSSKGNVNFHTDDAGGLQNGTVPVEGA